MADAWTVGNIQFWGIRVDQLREGVARRIVAAMKERIQSGALRPGEALPSTRALATEWGVSRTTVSAAYGQLIAEGCVTSRPGARTVVAVGLGARPGPEAPSGGDAGPLSAFARRLLVEPAPASAGAARIADFRYGDLSGADFPALAWKRAMTHVLSRRPARLGYDDPCGTGALRAALAAYLWRARAVRCDPEEVVIVNGSQQALDLCARLLLDPGDAFVIEDPGYPLARQAFAAAGGVAASIGVDAEGLRADALPPARLAYVTPSHQFPLGAVLSAPRRRALLDWAVAEGAWIVEDDYDGEYRHDVSPIPPLQALDPERVVYVGTVSKTLSPTLRIGYLVTPRALVPALAAAKRLTDRHTPVAGQGALADLLASGAYERHVRSIRRRNAVRRDALVAALNHHLGDVVTIAGAAAGLHLVVWLPGVPVAREATLADAARAAGVGLYPVSPTAAAGSRRTGDAGFIIGYAGLDAGAIDRGVAALAAVLKGTLRRSMPPA